MVNQEIGVVIGKRLERRTDISESSEDLEKD
jgi:hypothetical protein